MHHAVALNMALKQQLSQTLRVSLGTELLGMPHNACVAPATCGPMPQVAKLTCIESNEGALHADQGIRSVCIAPVGQPMSRVRAVQCTWMPLPTEALVTAYRAAADTVHHSAGQAARSGAACHAGGVACVVLHACLCYNCSSIVSLSCPATL